MHKAKIYFTFLHTSYIHFGTQINQNISAHHINFLCLVAGYIYCEYEQGSNGKSNITHYNENTYITLVQ
jgi:hypothetical protein